METIFRNDLTIKECADLIETWEGCRCSDGEENVFDLHDKTDFRLMREMRGWMTAVRLRKENRFWFDGRAYKTPIPFPKTEEGARQLAENMIGWDDIEPFIWLYQKYIK